MIATRRGCSLGLGTLREAMAENLAFYARLGFEEIERRVEDGYRCLYLSKQLS